MPRAVLLVLMLWLVNPVEGSTLSRLELKKLAIESKQDGIPSGWCGRAMLSLLNKAGLGDGLKSGNGQDWEKILLEAGWKPLKVSSPFKAPLGSVLVYASDRRVGKVPRGTPGGYYGHVEMVALAPTGGRLYVSDNPRPRPGGTVPDNFTGRAWVPPKTILATTAIPVGEQVDAVLADRMAMAESHFGRKSDMAKAEPPVITAR